MRTARPDHARPRTPFPSPDCYTCLCHIYTPIHRSSGGFGPSESNFSFLDDFGQGGGDGNPLCRRVAGYRPPCLVACWQAFDFPSIASACHYAASPSLRESASVPQRLQVPSSVIWKSSAGTHSVACIWAPVISQSLHFSK